MKIEIKNNPVFVKSAAWFSVIALLFACFLWQIRANISLKQELNTKNEEFKEAKSASKRLKKLQRQIQDLEEREKTINNKAPRNENQPLGLIRTLNGLAADIGLKNAVFTIKEKKSSDSQLQAMPAALPLGINSLRLEMSFEAALAQALDFLKMAAKIERVVAVEKIEVARKKEILPHQKVTLELVAYTFTAEN